MIDLSNIVYFICYFATICIFVALGSCMLMMQGNLIHTRGELKAKKRMCRSVGIYMLVWALQCFIYMPTILMYGYDSTGVYYYDLCYLITLMLNTPMLFVLMHAVVQRKINTLKWVIFTALPFLLLIVWFLQTPYSPSNRLQLYIATVLVLVSIAYLMFKYAKEYHFFIKRMKSEYSETTNKEIGWAWYCFTGLAFQSYIYLAYQFWWTAVFEYVYMAFSIVNALCFCYCVYHHKPLDEMVVESDEEIASTESVEQVQPEEKAFYTVIGQKLEDLCEGKMLFLDPDLTRESLCLRLFINRTYLSAYFRRQGTTFYQYINSLRIGYALKLLTDEPNMSIRQVSERSGFKSQTTFRKVFLEETGCLPSEIRVSGNTSVTGNNEQNKCVELKTTQKLVR